MKYTGVLTSETQADRAIRNLYLHTVRKPYDIRSDWGPKLWRSFGFTITGQYTHVVLDKQKFFMFVLEWA